MPRNMVAPYEVRSTEVRGAILQLKNASGRREIRTFLTSFSRLPDGHKRYIIDSEHFAFASLGSYPATISRTARALRHVLTNDLCYIASLIISMHKMVRSTG